MNPARACDESTYLWVGRFTKVSIDGHPAPDSVFFNCGSPAGTHRMKILGLVKPYLSHEPRLIMDCCRQLLINVRRSGSHSVREVNLPREINSSGPATGPCSILIATLGSLTIFSSGAIRYHSSA
jgi:hypothetical protein